MMARSLLVFIFVLLLKTALGLLTQNQKMQILAVFNKARATTRVPAADMKRLEWDEEIAALMQYYTDGCVSDHQEFYNPPAFFLYRDQGKDPVKVAKFRTLRMAPYFNLNTSSCIDTPKSRRICRHPTLYAKVNYAENERVGCGMTVCGKGAKKIFHACAVRVVPLNYTPILAWTPGPRCSKCPTGYEFCLGGLCSKHPTSAPSKNPITSRPTKSPTMRPTKSPGFKSKTPTKRHKRKMKKKGKKNKKKNNRKLLL